MKRKFELKAEGARGWVNIKIFEFDYEVEYKQTDEPTDFIVNAERKLNEFNDIFFFVKWYNFSTQLRN